MFCLIISENRVASLAHEIITRNKGDLLVGEYQAKLLAELSAMQQ